MVWASCALVQCAQGFIRTTATGATWTFGGAIVAVFPWWASWFLLTPLIAFVAAQFPVGDDRTKRSIAAIVLCGIAICAVQLTATGAAYWMTTGRGLGTVPSMGNQILRYFGSFFVESLLTYAAVVGTLVAVDFAHAVRDERVRRARAEAEATKAQLAALSMELNPHFLFNTMSAISGLIAQQRPAEARDVIRRLSDLLRRTLDSRDAIHSVASEMELLQDYLHIQRIRFDDRLQVHISVDENARTCRIPAMLLQPLLENAIRHGVEESQGNARVNVDLTRNNGTLQIAVVNSGRGFQLSADGQIEREGVGISNTRARLAHTYQERGRFELQNVPDGARVLIVIPAADS